MKKVCMLEGMRPESESALRAKQSLWTGCMHPVDCMASLVYQVK